MDRPGQKIKALFVANSNSMLPDSGGVQICTREYIAELELAGYELERVVFEPANGLKQKIARRIDPRPYRWFLPDDLADRVAERSRLTGANTIFLNNAYVAPLAEQLKSRLPDCKVVMLSHGLESVDYLHTLRTRNWRSDFSGLKKSDVLVLGWQIVEECRQRRSMDAVLCLAEFEAEIEKWLGARRVLVVPRTISPVVLDWKPVDGRVGFVGRLDHPPNLEGLLAMLEHLKRTGARNIEFRVVGDPAEFGARLEARFEFVRYLGPIPDDALLAEAVTWTCTANPVFFYSRGASTKLAVALGWGIPIATSLQGARGYRWKSGSPDYCDTPEAMAELVTRLATIPAEREEARRRVLKLLADPVTIDDVAATIRGFLKGDETHAMEAAI